MPLLYREVNEAEGLVTTYSRDDGGGSAVVATKKNLREISSNRLSSEDDPVLRHLPAFFRQVFLPEGYPASVSEDYLSYQAWDTLQAFASSVSGSLSTKAVLKGVGVGDETATPLAATTTWLLRHGAGMVGQIAFTWIQGSDLDYNCKRWRLFADIMNDGAMLLELTAPMWPQWTVQLVLCAAGVARSLVGVAGGATRAAITQHQARMNNISDVAAKDGSQETLVNLAALVVNLILLPWLGDDSLGLTWLLFLSLTLVHLFANYRAVKSLRFATLNRQRILDAFKQFEDRGRVPSIEEANLNESVLIGFGLSERRVLGRPINLGASFKTLTDRFRDGEPRLLENLVLRLEERGHFCVLSADGREVNVLLSSSGMSKSRSLEAYLEACFMSRTGEEDSECEARAEEMLELLQEAGWEVGYGQLGTQGWTGRGREKEFS